MKPRAAVLAGFAALILVGAGLLSLPCASPSGEWRDFWDSLFTATSAACITGLTVIDPGTELSPFGQGVLLALVQIGCVGIMTLGTFFLVVTGRRLSLAGEFSLSNAYGMTGVKGLRALVVWVVFSMLFVEALGAVVLWWQATAGVASWHDRLVDGTAWYRAFFYSAMSFCNAGFSLDPGSLATFRTSPVSLVVMGLEVFLGGIGFLVLYNVASIRFWRRNLVKRGRLSMHARVTIFSSLVLVAIAAVLFVALEGRTVCASVEGWWNRAAVVFFQALTPRTCGFTVIPMDDLHPATRFLSGVLMFVGAGPGSAGGGIKVTTLVVFLCTLSAICRGCRETVMSKRTVPEDVVREALVIFFFYVALIAAAMTLLLLSESGRPGITFEGLLFEAISAASTTGLSCGGTTAALSGFGRAVVLTAMFLGRIGALGVVLTIGGRASSVAIRYPKEELVVG